MCAYYTTYLLTIFSLSFLFSKILYNPRRVQGLGLSDGEVMERLWSYMRSFSKITKEMSSAHRQDFLSDAFIHFAKGKIINLGDMISTSSCSVKSFDKLVFSLIFLIMVILR